MKGQPRYKAGGWLQKEPEEAALGNRKQTAQPHVSAPRNLRIHLGPNSLQRWGFLVDKSARKGCWKRPHSTYEIRLTSESAPRLFAAFFKGEFFAFFGAPVPLQKVGFTGCKMSQERVPDKAAFETRSLAAQPRGSAPRILRLSKSALLVYFWRAHYLQKWGLLAAKSARKGRPRHLKSGCPTT